MASRVGTGNISTTDKAATTTTNASTVPVVVSASAAAYDDLRRHFYHAHITQHSPVTTDEYDHRRYSWNYAPSVYSYSSSSTVPYASPDYNYYPYGMGAPSMSPTRQDGPEDVSLGEPSQAADGRIEMDQDEVDAIIRNKRKVRDPKACYACHRRKVKCDRNLPCDSCVKRDHPELCSYERPTKKKRIAINNNLQAQESEGGQPDVADVVANAGPNVTVPKEQWERINIELRKLRVVVSQAQTSFAPPPAMDVDREEETQSLSRSDVADREGIHAPSNQMGTMHLGSRSVLAYMMGTRSKSSQDAARLLLEENILPKLGLDNETATYPFVDLWSTDSSISDVSGLCRALPDDSLIHEFWVSYRDVACTIYPVVPDKVQFEKTLNFMLHRRAELVQQGGEIDPNRPYGVSVPWLALVFAVLASGAQCGTLRAKERELTSQVYICCAYQALRMANFLSHPCLDTIEACLIIGNALAYNMNPGVAYIFLGMTLRSALSMGLHVNSHGFTERENYLRGRIWWALAWQDSHFSISYDRPSSSILCLPDIPYAKDSGPGKRSYVESMFAVIKLTQEILRDRTLSPNKAMSFAAIQKYKDQMYRIIIDAGPKLKDRQQCMSVIEHMERCAFQLHFSYMLSEICRPALKETHATHSSSHSATLSPVSGRRKSSTSATSAASPSSTSGDPGVQASLRAECIMHLERAVEAYVDLHSHSIFPCRSWIGIQRSISAAFLLGIVPETRQEPRIVNLLMELERCIAQRAAEDIGFAPNEALGSPHLHSQRRLSGQNANPVAETPNWASSMTKSLHALGKLNQALAASPQCAPSQTQPRSYGPIQQQPTQPPVNAGTMYATPVVSPGSGSHAKLQPAMPGGPISPYQAVPLPPHLQHRSHRLGSPTGQGQSGYIGAAVVGGITPVTPDSVGSTASEWHYGNLSEHVMEYVQPGLWG